MNELNHVVAAVEQKLSLKRRKQMLPVIREIETLLSKHNKIVYGGMAQNLSLPKSKRFYKETDLPDYDVYSDSAQKFAIKVADHLSKAGYDNVEVRCALHKGTYKVYWDFTSVLDITDVSRPEMTLLWKRSNVARIRLCPIHLLKANAYLELAQPDTAYYRWAKVYARLRLLEDNKPIISTFQPNIHAFSMSNIPELNDLVRDSIELTKRLQLPIAGVHAIRHYLGLPTDTRSTLHKRARLQVVSTSPEQHLKQYMAILNAFRTRVYTTNAKNTFCPRKENLDVYIKGKWYRFISIHDGKDRCVAIHTVQKTKYASVFYCIYMAYYHLYKYNNNIDKQWLKQLVNRVSISDFKVNCYGNAKTVYNIKREKAKLPEWSYRANSKSKSN